MSHSHDFIKRRPNHHSSRPNRRQQDSQTADQVVERLSDATTTVARGRNAGTAASTTRRSRPRTSSANTRGSRPRSSNTINADTGTVLQTQQQNQTQATQRYFPPTTTTSNTILATTAPSIAVKVAASSSTSIPTASSSRSTLSSSPSSSSSSSSASSANLESTPSSNPNSTTTTTKSTVVPAFLASLGVVAFLGLIIWLCRRKRRQNRNKSARDALTSLAPDPYYIDNEKSYGDDSMEEIMRSEKHGSNDSAQPQYAGRPKSFLDSLRWTLLGRKSLRKQQQAEIEEAQSNWPPTNRAESPPVPRMPAPNQLNQGQAVDPFSGGFVGADVLAQGLASSSTHTHSAKGSVSSNQQLAAAIPWNPQDQINQEQYANVHPASMSSLQDVYEEYSQPNIRQLYSGLQRTNSEFSATSSEGSRGDPEEAFVYALSGDERSQSMAGKESLAASGTDGRSIHFGTIRTVSSTQGQPVAWRRV